MRPVVLKSVVHEAMGHGQKSFVLSVARSPAPLRVSSHFPRMLRHWRLSPNDTGDDEVKPEVVHRSFYIYLKAGENAGKLN